MNTLCFDRLYNFLFTFFLSLTALSVTSPLLFTWVWRKFCVQHIGIKGRNLLVRPSTDTGLLSIRDIFSKSSSLWVVDNVQLQWEGRVHKTTFKQMFKGCSHKTHSTFSTRTAGWNARVLKTLLMVLKAELFSAWHVILKCGCEKQWKKGSRIPCGCVHRPHFNSFFLKI